MINVARPTFARNDRHRPFLYFGVGSGVGGGGAASAKTRLLVENALRLFNSVVDDLDERQALRVAAASALDCAGSENYSASKFSLQPIITLLTSREMHFCA